MPRPHRDASRQAHAVCTFFRAICTMLGMLSVLAFTTTARAEDGYNLWLRNAPLASVEADAMARHIGLPQPRAGEDPKGIEAKARQELVRGLPELAGGRTLAGPPVTLVRSDRAAGPERAWAAAIAGKPAGAYRLVARGDGGVAIVANDDAGLLYGAFALLRHLALGARPDRLDTTDAPRLPLRLLNQWDNLDGSVERGYAGRSIIDWWRLPDYLDRRLVDYARANASVGINGVVVNNVNASALVLTDRYIAKLARIADAWRPYGIRVFVSARFSAPRELGGLPTADPLDPAVRAWWKARAQAIEAAIPDFGGFLVKANSEGQPGPQDYHRTHADGANMLAAAVGPHSLVIWRAFVYASSASADRANLAYDEFAPLDGTFADNVIVQVKNGPIDFQPREPFHPLFGAMPHTRMMMEVQLTKEYLGQGTHLAYLGPMWTEVLDSETGRGSARVADTLASGGMAGVANVGSDRNWTATHFDQANWYAFGRLAWDPTLDAAAIAREWSALTFNRDPRFVDGATAIMMPSRQAEVDVMTPLGLAHQMATGSHYGPGPWVSDLARPEWNSVYYARADAGGIGFERGAAGSNALARYAPAAAARWADPRTMDEDYLLWFHHLPWTFRMRSGRMLYDELIARYDRGVGTIDAMARHWQALAPWVDAARFADTAAFLKIQQNEARWWRDASIAWWTSVSGLPLPRGTRPPAHDLAWYRAQQFPDAPGN